MLICAIILVSNLQGGKVMARRLENLPSFLVERGTVKKEVILDGFNGVTVVNLFLCVGAKVKLHPHNSENEIYKLETGTECICTIDGIVHELGCGDSCICLAGQSHDLENTSGHPIKVISIKYPPT